MKVREKLTANGSKGVFTHVYTTNDVQDALKQVSERERPYFRSGGRLDPETSEEVRAEETPSQDS